MMIGFLVTPKTHDLHCATDYRRNFYESMSFHIGIRGVEFLKQH